MKNEDVDLIQRILSGDENAVHCAGGKTPEVDSFTLQWREIGDFHAALRDYAGYLSPGL